MARWRLHGTVALIAFAALSMYACDSRWLRQLGAGVVIAAVVAAASYFGRWIRQWIIKKTGIIARFSPTYRCDIAAFLLFLSIALEGIASVDRGQARLVLMLILWGSCHIYALRIIPLAVADIIAQIDQKTEPRHLTLSD